MRILCWRGSSERTVGALRCANEATSWVLKHVLDAAGRRVWEAAERLERAERSRVPLRRWPRATGLGTVG